MNTVKLLIKSTLVLTMVASVGMGQVDSDPANDTAGGSDALGLALGSALTNMAELGGGAGM